MSDGARAKRSIVVVGAGIFGVTASISLARRGDRVTLIDPGPIPHPLAESTDISKIIRADYGSDDLYTAMMERALSRWRDWNAHFGGQLFHETGVMFVSRRPMEEGGFENDSFTLLSARGHHLERLNATQIGVRYPAWRSGRFVDGYWNPQGGYAESGNVVRELVDQARGLGVIVREQVRFARLIEEGSRVVGIVAQAGEKIVGDVVVVAAGGWTLRLLPFLAGTLRTVGQPVFHLLPKEPELFHPARFPVFGADLARTGYYGFPRDAQGIVKIANHGVGRAMDPDSPERVVTAAETEAFRAFLEDTFPALAGAPIAATRICVYCDTHDEHFLIAPDPDRQGLVVATGGSGHAFKFAPVIGDVIADAVDGVVVPRFRWRSGEGQRGQEAARHRG